MFNEKTQYEIMFGLIKMFIGLLSASDCTTGSFCELLASLDHAKLSNVVKVVTILMIHILECVF